MSLRNTLTDWTDVRVFVFCKMGFGEVIWMLCGFRGLVLGLE